LLDELLDELLDDMPRQVAEAMELSLSDNMLPTPYCFGEGSAAGG
jgi:hypothetical protein